MNNEMQETLIRWITNTVVLWVVWLSIRTFGFKLPGMGLIHAAGFTFLFQWFSWNHALTQNRVNKPFGR